MKTGARTCAAWHVRLGGEGLACSPADAPTGCCLVHMWKTPRIERACPPPSPIPGCQGRTSQRTCAKGVLPLAAHAVGLGVQPPQHVLLFPRHPQQALQREKPRTPAPSRGGHGCRLGSMVSYGGACCLWQARRRRIRVQGSQQADAGEWAAGWARWVMTSAGSEIRHQPL